MDLRHFAFAFTVLLAVAILPQSEAIKCYVCNSADHTKCNDEFYHPPTEEGAAPVAKSGSEFEKDCDVLYPDKKMTLCRKIYQNVRGEERVIRDCGYIEYKNPCYKTVLEEYNTYVCTCKDKDLCNAGTSISVSYVTVLSSVVALFWVFKQQH